MSFLPLLLLLLFLLAILDYHKQKKLILQIRELSTKEKRVLLHSWMKSSCLSYLPRHDIFTYKTNTCSSGSTHDIWGNFTRFTTLTRSLPIYFNYNGKTWLLQLEQGQYGIYFGGSAGLYYTDYIVSPDNRDLARFTIVKQSEKPQLSLELFKQNMSIFHLSRRHWHLSGFCIGICHPDDQTAFRVSVTFPNTLMLQSFIRGLLNAGYSECEIMIRGLNVSFLFRSDNIGSHCLTHFEKLRQHTKLWCNNSLCKLYFFLTCPFECTLDKLIYLHTSCPFAFRLLCHVTR